MKTQYAVSVRNVPLDLMTEGGDSLIAEDGELVYTLLLVRKPQTQRIEPHDATTSTLTRHPGGARLTMH